MLKRSKASVALKCIIARAPIAAVPRICRCIIPVRIITFPRSLGFRAFWLRHMSCGFRLAFDDFRGRFVCRAFDFGGGRSLRVLREQSRRPLGNDRGRRRLIGSQTGVVNILRLKERVEPEDEQTQYGQIHRHGDTEPRTISLYTIRGHRCTSHSPPSTTVAKASTGGIWQQSGNTLNFDYALWLETRP